ncbi:MAG: hypothetical protein WCR31_07730 [Treponema sp.]
MGQGKETDALVEEFIDKKTIKALTTFIESNNETDFSVAADIIAEAFGSDAETFSKESAADDKKLLVSFKNNLTLLIQKTWVEKTDIELKEQVLYQLEQFRTDGRATWKSSYKAFLKILYNAVYLMFGQQVETEDFCEYALRIDPEFGIFWWYVKSLPQNVEWAEEKCRDAILLGMYFLANY